MKVSDGLRNQTLFRKEFIAMVAAAELTGNLGDAFLREAASLRFEIDLGFKWIGQFLPKFIYSLICIYVIIHLFTGVDLGV